LCFVGSSRTRFLSSSSKASRSRSSERSRRKIRSFAERSAGGRRIVRSERSDNELRKKRQKLYGIQIWIGLPKQYEETDLTSPIYQRTCCFESLGEGKILRVIADSFFGKASPVRPFELFYADPAFDAGASLLLDSESEERGITSWRDVPF
jgi:redox-sensitive bicupin YhaK (pirin superfamily)